MRTHFPRTIAWMTDLHLEATTTARRKSLYEQITRSSAHCFVITGDISKADLLPLHLRELANAAKGRAVYFTLGNHDFYGSTFRDVDRMVAGVCQIEKNLRHLNGNQVIQIDAETALVGHRGWPDGRLGWTDKSLAKNPDFKAIKTFTGLTQEGAFRLLRSLGEKSAYCLRNVLPYALTCYNRVVIATHVPPFLQAALFNEAPCDKLRQPFFCNASLGNMIVRMAANFPRQEIIVLAGHTHAAASVAVAKNVHALTAAARTGFPSPGQILQFGQSQPNGR